MKERNQLQVVSEFVKAINSAYMSSWGMVHHHMDPRFSVIRDRLERVKNMAINLAAAKAKQAHREAANDV